MMNAANSKITVIGLALLISGALFAGCGSQTSGPAISDVDTHVYAPLVACTNAAKAANASDDGGSGAGRTGLVVRKPIAAPDSDPDSDGGTGHFSSCSSYTIEITGTAQADAVILNVGGQEYSITANENGTFDVTLQVTSLSELDGLTITAEMAGDLGMPYVVTF